jgi:hypothetical protein
MPALKLFLTALSRFFSSPSLIRSSENAEKVTLIPAGFSGPRCPVLFSYLSFSHLPFSKKTFRSLFVPPSIRGTKLVPEGYIHSLNPQSKIHTQQSTMAIFVSPFVFRITNIRIALQQLTCMLHACIISLASALAGCQGVRLFVSRLPRISA